LFLSRIKDGPVAHSRPSCANWNYLTRMQLKIRKWLRPNLHFTR